MSSENKDPTYTSRQLEKDRSRLQSALNTGEITPSQFKAGWKKVLDRAPTPILAQDKNSADYIAQYAAKQAVSKKLNVPEEKFDKFYERKIRPTTTIINFNLGGHFIKRNALFELKEYLLEGYVKEGFDETIQDIGTPSIEDIDYSVVKSTDTSKYGRLLTRYKDGFLIVSDISPKEMLFFTTFKHENNQNILTPILRFNDEVFYLDSSIEKTKDLDFKNLNLYFVFTKAHKNKAYVIPFENHKELMNSLERCKEVSTHPDFSLRVYRSFPEKITKGIALMNGVMDMITHLKNVKTNGSEELKNKIEKNINSIPKKDLLKASYYYSFAAMIHGFVSQVISTEKDEKLRAEVQTEEYGILKKFYECKDEVEVSKELHRFLTNNKFSLKDYYSVKERIYLTKYKQPNTLHTKGTYFTVDDTVDCLMNIYFMYNETNEGTELLTKGPIDTSKATQIDCMYYWRHSDLFSKSFGFIDKSDFPLFIDYNKIFNKNNLADHLEEFRQQLPRVNRYNEDYQLGNEAAEKTSLLLNEAMNNSTGLLIPYDACIELREDSIFKYARFIETNKFIHIFLHDENDRYIPELFCKESCEFRYWVVNRAQVTDEPENLRGTFDRLYVKLAAGIRNWKVLIERNRTMAVRTRPMVPTGVKSNRKRWIYLPRVKYIDNPDQEQRTRQKKFFNESRKFSGTRRHHTRRLPAGMKPSKTQLVLAEANNVYLRDNETYVKASVWGIKGMTERQIKYRTEPLTNGILFMPDDEFSKHQEIADMCPAKFEEHCAKYIESLGYQVYKKWNYDGGIDVRGMKDIEDGKVQRLFVQCKHPIESGSPIGPDVVRELQGSVDLEMKDLEDCEIEKMVITSTRYTYKAVEAAEKLGIKLKTTDDMKG